MTVMERRPNTVLRRIREVERRETRDAFAAAMAHTAQRLGENVACSERTVARFEDGDVARPQAPYRRVLAALTGRHFDDLGFPPRATVAPALRADGHSAGEEPDLALLVTGLVTGLTEDDMRRRDLFTLVNGLTLVNLGREWADAPTASAPAAVDLDGVPTASIVASVEGVLHHVRALEGLCDSALLTRTVDAQLALVSPLLKDQSAGTDTGRRLYATCAELLRLSGWYAFDQGHYGLAQRHLSAALRAARAAGEVEIGLHVLSFLSMVQAWVGDPRDAVDIIESAGRLRERVSPRLGAAVAARAAFAHGKAGDLLSMRRALDESASRFEASRTTASPPWLDYFDEAMLEARAGHCFLEVGDDRSAATQFGRAINRRSGPQGRDHSIWWSRLALARSRTGDLDEACSTGMRAVHASERTASARTADHVTSLLRELRPHRSDPRVRELADATRGMFA